MKSLIILTAFLLLSSCQTQKKWIAKGQAKGWLIDSTKTETKFIQGEIKLLKDTMYISSSDTLRTDSTITITNNFYKEKHFYQKDTLIINNTTTTHVESEGTNVVPWWYWLILSLMGVVILGLTFRK